MERASHHGSGNGAKPTLGTLRGNQYHHQVTGVDVTLTAGWKFSIDSDSSGGGEMLILGNADTHIQGFLWLKPYDGAGDIPGELRGDVENKIQDRGSFENWRIRPESVLPRFVNGVAAISAVADYKDNGHAMTEYLTWVRSKKTRGLFFSRVPAEDLPDMRIRMDSLISNTTVPQ